MSISVRQWDDAASWNRFIGSVPDAHFQQSWEWGELGPALGGRAVRLMASDGDRPVSAVQVFENAVGSTGRSQLMVPRGPVAVENSIRTFAPLADAIRSLGMERRSIGVRVEPNAHASEACQAQVLAKLGFHPSHPPSQPRSSWVLDVTPDDEALLAGMKQKTRYNIRLAARKGVEVCEASVDDVGTFYELYQDTARRDGFFVHKQSLYRSMFSLFDRSGSFCMLFARFEGTIIAAVTLIRLGNTTWYLHGASSNSHRNLMAPYLLQWEAIQRAKRWGCSVYDFRAVPDVLRDDQDMFGVYRFKEGFGGHQMTTLPSYAMALQPGLFGLWQAYYSGRFALQQFRRKRAGLPVRQFA